MEFKNLTLDVNLIRVSHEPTRGINTLCLLLTSAPETMRPVMTLNGFSYHDLLQVTINVILPVTGVSKKITFSSSVFSREDHTNLPSVDDYEWQYMESMEVTVEGVACFINNLKLSSSVGVDDISFKLLKNYRFCVC